MKNIQALLLFSGLMMSSQVNGQPPAPTIETSDPELVSAQTEKCSLTQ